MNCSMLTRRVQFQKRICLVRSGHDRHRPQARIKTLKLCRYKLGGHIWLAQRHLDARHLRQKAKALKITGHICVLIHDKTREG